jgi:hypothetical protein
MPGGRLVAAQKTHISDMRFLQNVLRVWESFLIFSGNLDMAAIPADGQTVATK